MSRRRDLEDLEIRTSIGDMLPAMFHEDDMAQRWCSGLDDVVAPIPATLDSFWAYLDPALAPLDFVEWLAAWVGLELDQTWSEQRRRGLVARAHGLHDYRGTARGLADLIELYTGARPEITDGGGVGWSATPGGELPGDDEPRLVVRLRVADPESIDRDRLENMVELNKPAHVVHRVEIEAGTSVVETVQETADEPTASEEPDDEAPPAADVDDAPSTPPPPPPPPSAAPPGPAPPDPTADGGNGEDDDQDDD